jgi:hypothetical protein
VKVLRVRDALEVGKELKRASSNYLVSPMGNTPLMQIRRRTKYLRRVRFNNSFEAHLPSDWKNWI